MSSCPTWCVADHAGGPDAREHHGTTHVVAVTLEGRGSSGPHEAELIVEVSRRHGEAAVWVYLGDGWTGFSLSLESATRLSAELAAVVDARATSARRPRKR